jgi:hypothetical protein
VIEGGGSLLNLPALFAFTDFQLFSVIKLLSVAFGSLRLQVIVHQKCTQISTTSSDSDGRF